MTRIEDFEFGDMYLMSGKTIRPAEITAADIDHADIIHSICGTPRFNGHLPMRNDIAFTVGQHTLAMYTASLLMEETEGVRRTILLHDMHEYITGDIPTPVKCLLGPEIGALEDKVDQAIFASFNHLATPSETARCKDYDNLMWKAELHVIRDLEWNRLHDDIYRALVSAIINVHALPPEQVGRMLIAAIGLEFFKEEPVQ